MKIRGTIAVNAKHGWRSRPDLTVLLIVVSLCIASGAIAEKAPFGYLFGTAHHVLPETHDYESGYFSLSEGTEGEIYVGTAKYGVNAYLVRLEPESGKQRIVIDTHRLCGIEAKGMAAQAKIHTRNHVAASGRIYVGSKQGYPTGDDRHTDYPGGYLMRYDPRRDEAQCLGRVPFVGHGVIDVVADEKRNILYVVTNHDETRGALWLQRSIEGRDSDRWKGLHSNPVFYGQTLLDRRGMAHMLDRDARVITYNPENGTLRARPMTLDGQRFKAPDGPPTWITCADGINAYLVYMTAPTLYRLDLTTDADVIELKNLGRTVAAERTDSRCALSIGPDANVYVVMRRPNDTGFGKGHLHHLVRYDPESGTMSDLGVLAVQNPDFFDFKNATTRSDGFRKLPDGTFSPDVVHLAMIISSNGDAFITFLYPFTVLHVKGVVSRAGKSAIE